MQHLSFYLIIAVVVVLIFYRRIWPRLQADKPARPHHRLITSKSLYTVAVFSRLNTRRFFRDRLALFFAILFPLIFLFVFGSFSRGNGNNVSFRVAVINHSQSSFARQFEHQLNSTKVFKVNKTLTTLRAAEDKMSKSQLDAAIVLPSNFGEQPQGATHPSGQAKVVYTQNSEQAGQTLTTVLQGQFDHLNSQYVTSQQPFKAVGEQLNEKSLSAFDYTFAGLVGFSIIGLGIFGPMNVFPELKKQGILRRLHTTPLRVWQYFLSTMISQALIGLVALSIMFVVAITVFNLDVVGNYIEIAAFLVFGIMMILGIGLSIGGWARNERQAAPLGNIVVFPMMFLSGTFFPRFLMPEWLQTVSGYLPLTPVIDGARMLITEGKHLTQIGHELVLIVVWMVVIYAVAFRVFRWE